MPDLPAILASARATIDSAADRLAAADARTEVVAEFVAPRRRFGIPRPATMRLEGRAWRLGVLLLTQDGALRATGETIRIVDPGTRSAVSHTAEVRRELRQAARRAGIAEGDTVDLGSRPIPLDDSLASAVGPVVLRGDAVRVRWTPTGGDAALVDLDRYLDERVDLLVHPPQGA
ncbi:MAG: hypothetical protein ABW040_07835 [Microbacteriaceae bacterium]